MKRFTETDKWRDPWFRSLTAPAKLAFFYILDHCNNAGFHELDTGLMVILTGMKAEHVEGALKGLERSIKGPYEGWYWVRRFLKHQKNAELNPLNPAHKQIILLTRDQLPRFNGCPEFQEFVDLHKGLFRPIGVGTGKGKGKKKESPEREKQAEEIYLAYPRREKKPDALRAILLAMDKCPADTLLERTRLYASIRPRDQWTPLPASWFNAEQFNDDPENWKVKNGAKPLTEQQSKLDREFAEAQKLYGSKQSG